MRDSESNQELLLRYLDGNLLPEQEDHIADLLRSDPEARAFLREVAEQAVTIADVERVKEGRQGELGARHDWLGKSYLPSQFHSAGCRRHGNHRTTECNSIPRSSFPSCDLANKYLSVLSRQSRIPRY